MLVSEKCRRTVIIHICGGNLSEFQQNIFETYYSYATFDATILIYLVLFIIFSIMIPKSILIKANTNNQLFYFVLLYSQKYYSSKHLTFEGHTIRKHIIF